MLFRRVFLAFAPVSGVAQTFQTFMIPILFMTLTTPPSFAKVVVIDRVEASVNGTPILKSDLGDFRKTAPLRAQLDPLFSGTSLAEKGPSAPDKDVVDFLVSERLILDAFPVNAADTETEINSIQAGLRFDRKALKLALSEQGFRFEDYFELIRASVSKRNLIDRDIRTKVYISDDDVKNSFYQGQTASGGPRSYSVQIITFSTEAYANQGAAQAAAREAKKAVGGGVPFADIAKKYGDAALTGGTTDPVTIAEEDMAQNMRSVVKQLRVGDVSDVQRTDNKAFVLVKLIDIHSAESSELVKKKEEIRNRLASQEYQRQIGFWLERERQKAHIHLRGGPALGR